MKKSLLLIASVVMSTVAAFAQWTRPVPAFEPMADDGATVQYMYNVEFGGFFLGGNDWNTRASVSSSKGYKVKITAQFEDDEKTVPLNTWAIIDSVETQKAWKATFCENAQSIWVDNNSGANWDKWIITSIGGNMYEITNPDAGAGKLGATEVYEGATGNTRLWLLDYSITDDEENPIMSGTPYTTWAFVSPDEYTAWVDKMAQYTAAVTLGNYIETSEEECPGIDLSAAKLVYSNTESTPDELAQALADAKEVVNAWKSSQATATDPKDVSDFIENSTFDVIGNFTGWKGTAFGAGGATSTCAEHYSKNYDTYQDVNGGEDIPNGIYKVSVVGFYRAGSIANDWATRDDASYRYAKMYAKSGEDSLYVSVPSLSSWAAPSNIGGVATGDNNDLFVPNSMAQFTTFKEAGYGHTISVFVPVEDNKLRVGVVKTTLLDTDWSIFDDFTLTYYGDADDAYQLWRDEMVEAAEADFTSVLDNATFYYKAAVTDYNNYLELAKGATAKEDIKTYVKGIQSVSEEALASIKAYQDYFDRQKEILEFLAEHEDLVGDDVDILTDFIADGELILEAGELDTEGITAALATLNEMFDAALRSGAAEGTDMTSLVEISQKAWNGIYCSITFAPSITTFDGRTAQMVESYESTVETIGTILSQSVSVPYNGFYTVELYANACYTSGRGFESNVVEGQLDVAYVFANDKQVPVPVQIATSVSENGLYIIKGVEVIDGVIKIGLKKSSAGTNWNMIQIRSLQCTSINGTIKNYSHLIKNADCSSMDGWNYWGHDIPEYGELWRTWHLYTGEYSNDGAYLDNFIERWVYNGTNLEDGVLSQKITGLPIGDYRVYADIIACQQSGGTGNETGTYLFAESGGVRDSVNTCTSNGVPKTFHVDMEVVNGELTIGFETVNSQMNWIAVDNWRLLLIKEKENITLDRDLTIEYLSEKLNLNITSNGKLIIAKDAINDSNGIAANSISMEVNPTENEYAQVFSYLDQNLSVNGDLSERIYTHGMTWNFLSLPFDCDLSRLATDDGTAYAIRYYDGASRAAKNLAQGNWKDYDKNDIIPMGTGFIYMTQNDTWTQFYAVNNESKNHVFQSTSGTTILSMERNESVEPAHSGWNLLGNPYANYYSIHAMNFDKAVTYWNGNTYEVYFPNDDDMALKPNQAFFVQCPENTFGITMLGSGRQLTSEISSGAKARRIAMNKGKSRKLINLSLSDSEFTDKTRVVFNDEASMDYELECDASKFMSMRPEVPQLYSLGINGTKYAVNERPMNDGTVKLGLYIPTDGNYTLTMTRNDAEQILLTDNETGQTVDLTDDSYSFYAKKGTYNNRLMLTFGTVTGMYNLPCTMYNLQGGEEYFDLSGRRISKPTKAGIYLLKQGKTVQKVQVK